MINLWAFFSNLYPASICFQNTDSLWLLHTVKPVLSGHLKIDKTKVLMENVSLMKVESIAECSPWSILQYFGPALSDNRY